MGLARQGVGEGEGDCKSKRKGEDVGMRELTMKSGDRSQEDVAGVERKGGARGGRGEKVAGGRRAQNESRTQGESYEECTGGGFNGQRATAIHIDQGPQQARLETRTDGGRGKGRRGEGGRKRGELGGKGEGEG